MKIYVINGSGGTGKDTFCEITAKYYKVRNVSSITPIVEIAKFAGWDGEKTDKARRLLARLKEVFTEYNDLSFNYCVKQANEFLKSDEQIMFVHIREPKEIERFKEKINCNTILVRRQSVTDGKVYGNSADDEVENYNYDYIIDNNGDLEQLENTVKSFFEKQVIK